MKSIPVTPVTSSQVAGIGYDPESKTLAVQFHPRKSAPDEPGAIYHYSGVEREAHDALINAESIGKHFDQHVKFGYEYQRIEQEKREEAEQQEESEGL
jgi:hypothetical protein